MKHNLIKTAFVGFGEINSPQELIKEMCDKAREEVKSPGIEVVSTGHVTDDPEGKDVQRAINDLKQHDFDSLILCLAGWIPSHAVISITEEFRDKPMILWGLAGKTENGRVVTPAPQLPSLDIHLDVPVDDFAQKVAGQHYIIAYGDHTGVLKDYCYLKNIEVV